MHFDTAFSRIVLGTMLEFFDIEIRPQFPVDTVQEVKIELRCNTLRVVIGRV